MSHLQEGGVNLDHVQWSNTERHYVYMKPFNGACGGPTCTQVSGGHTEPTHTEAQELFLGLLAGRVDTETSGYKLHAGPRLHADSLPIHSLPISTVLVGYPSLPMSPTRSHFFPPRYPGSTFGSIPPDSEQ